MSYAAGIDSHWDYVRTRLLTINSSRLVKGMLNAQDWPAKDVKLEAFYLLVLPDSPSPASTRENPVMQHNLQWVWIIAGSGVPATARQANRGTAYRTNQLMKDELLKALYPGYCEKKSWTLDGNGRFIGTALEPQEFVSWSTQPKFLDKWDKESGLVYGSAPLVLVNMLDQLAP